MQDDVSAIVQAALGSEPEYALSNTLETIAKRMDGLGCILWQTAPKADFTSHPPHGHLFVLASWFPPDAETKVCAIHDLPLEGSQTGSTVCTGRAHHSNDIWHDELVMSNDQFLRANQLTRMLSVPVSWGPNTTVRVALNVYATDGRVEFSETDERKLERLVANLHELYRSVRDRLGFRLVQNVERIVHDAEQRAADGVVSEKDQQAVMTDICATVAKAFHTLETSVFLEDPTDPRSCKLMGTNWQDPFPQKRYLKRANDGVTGWVLERTEAVRIFDLAHFDRDYESIQKQYPDITWEVSPVFMEVTLRKLPQRQHETVWPMSFMAAPVVSGKSSVGAIRCCTAKAVPYYFSDDDLDLLGVVAAQISRCWSTWATQRKAAEREHRLEEEVRQKTAETVRTFEDLSHQLRGPLLQAERQVFFALDRASGSSGRHQLLAVRGLCRKAKRVTLSIGLLAAESTGADAKRFNPAALDYPTLDRMLTEAAEDAQILADPGRPVRFRVDHRSYDLADIHRFRVDYDLLEQAVSNLLDNAAKYSFADSTVRISGGLTGKRNFHISVANRGIKLRREDRTECIARGWRGQEAILCADLGSGIGLWVVEQIMKTHGGSLVVEPTTREHVTEFKLVFPPHE